MIFLADGASMLVPIALLLGPLRHLHGRAERPVDDLSPASYLTILRNPAVRWLTALTFLATFVGYGQMEAGFPAFARRESEVSTDVIGLAFAVNTAVIVGLQFLVLRLIGDHRRTRVLLLMTVLWASSWTVLGLTGLVPASAAAIAGVLAFHADQSRGERPPATRAGSQPNRPSRSAAARVGVRGSRGIRVAWKAWYVSGLPFQTAPLGRFCASSS